MDFVDKLQEALIVEDFMPEDSLSARLDALKSELSELQSREKAIKRELDQLIERLCVKLAEAIKVSHPGLGVRLDKGRCVANYFTKTLEFKPNIDTHTWDIEPTVTGRKFSRQLETALPLDEDPDNIADKILNFFREKFKTLQKESFAGSLVKPKFGTDTYARRAGEKGPAPTQDPYKASAMAGRSHGKTTSLKRGGGLINRQADGGGP